MRQHQQTNLVAPVRVKRDAFGHKLPVRDLILWPKHCLFIGGKPVPAKLLINHTTILQELDTPSVLIITSSWITEIHEPLARGLRHVLVVNRSIAQPHKVPGTSRLGGEGQRQKNPTPFEKYIRPHVAWAGSPWITSDGQRDQSPLCRPTNSRKLRPRGPSGDGGQCPRPPNLLPSTPSSPAPVSAHSSGRRGAIRC